MSDRPDFWRRGGATWPQMALIPASLMWRAGAFLRRATASPQRTSKPVICVGNLDVGGSGKTPTVRLLTEWFGAWGISTGVLSRGYGGSLSGRTPVRVDPASHTAAEVGDEALLHAASAPTMISVDRAAGAALLAPLCDVIVMDDGFQNPSLVKDFSLLVANAGDAFGNGAVMPAGPLREPLQAGLARADALLAIGTGGLDDRLSLSSLPVLRARLVAETDLSGQQVLGFCGIGRPERFRQTLIECGADIVAFRAFADHHPYSDHELEALQEAASARGAKLITTEKDLVRLPDRVRENVQTVPVRLELAEPGRLEALLDPILSGLRTRASDAEPPNRSG